MATPHAIGSEPPQTAGNEPLLSCGGVEPLPSATQSLHAVRGPAASAARTLESCELLAGASEVRIRHGAELYRLRVTQNGKLILQK